MERIFLNYAGALKEVIGREGIPLKEIRFSQRVFSTALDGLLEKRKKKLLGFMDLPHNLKMLEKTALSAASLRGRFEYLVVCGIGGSALGTTAVMEAVKGVFHNTLSGGSRQGWLKIIVADNISPEFIKTIIEMVPLRRTAFFIASKSGTTSETISVFSILMNIMKRRLGNDWKKYFFFATDPEKGFLRDFGNKNGIEMFDVPSNVGGRFSVLTPVCLFPLAAGGVNIKKLAKGARESEKFCLNKILLKNPAGMFAVLHWLFYKRGKRMHGFVPYGENLRSLSDWFAQLWAESLGKRKGRGFVGPTPLKAKGVTDQHSQLQLWTEGPADKVITFVSTEKIKMDLRIPPLNDFIFGGRKLSELFRAEETGTKQALAKAGRPFLSIKLPSDDEFHIGALLYLLETATAMSGELFGINAFDQPGVEYGKIVAKKILSGDKKILEETKLINNPKYNV